MSADSQAPVMGWQESCPAGISCRPHWYWRRHRVTYHTGPQWGPDLSPGSQPIGSFRSPWTQTSLGLRAPDRTALGLISHTDKWGKTHHIKLCWQNPWFKSPNRWFWGHLQVYTLLPGKAVGKISHAVQTLWLCWRPLKSHDPHSRPTARERDELLFLLICDAELLDNKALDYLWNTRAEVFEVNTYAYYRLDYLPNRPVYLVFCPHRIFSFSCLF